MKKDVNKTAETTNLKTLLLRAILILFLFIPCCMLTSCDPGSFNFKSEDLSEVVKIELINYDNPQQKHFFSWVPDHSSDLKPFDDSKASVLESLDKNRISDFCDTLCNSDILYLYYAYDSPNGICLKLTYSDGKYIIIWSAYEYKSYAGYIGSFYPDGSIAEFFGSFTALTSFKILVNNYFNTKILLE